MRKRLLVLFDVLVLGGFGVYLAATVWQLPPPLRQRLVSASLNWLLQVVGV